jgi:hypothetical protein
VKIGREKEQAWADELMLALDASEAQCKKLTEQ